MSEYEYAESYLDQADNVFIIHMPKPFTITLVITKYFARTMLIDNNATRLKTCMHNNQPSSYQLQYVDQQVKAIKLSTSVVDQQVKA